MGNPLFFYVNLQAFLQYIVDQYQGVKWPTLTHSAYAFGVGSVSHYDVVIIKLYNYQFREADGGPWAGGWTVMLWSRIEVASLISRALAWYAGLFLFIYSTAFCLSS